MSIEVGSKLSGKVTGITHFGAFVELPGGVTGLVHISEVDDQYVKDIHEFLKINDVVTVKVLNVEPNGKIGLSIRQAKPKSAPDPVTRRAMDRNFEDKLSRFLKDSEERLTTLRRSTESKRGGRGSRRSY
ncbi:putative RNA degradation protein; polyribonucleotide nucleotidyltransferase or phosphorylase [[Clostridium] ultunense Esp]|uniref:S1 domain-containing RNA-binding protein n=1 Tax=Thermicanus aegyptius TaxID=94009 RepID=UPI0002B6FDD9|nr:S1 domain-containing RNA-binding protein [Thermicanus aegyptius]CCQ93450.1 putative RNA degradation protein; polyribonucleotide nucleotidyltransferase or phosphorylase [[Clostridium] ultunense Esp]